MEFVDVVRARRMVRNYDADRNVSRETVEALLKLAIRAPSAGFSQGWHFLVLDSPDTRAEFWRSTVGDDEPDSWLRGMQSAPVIVLTLSDKDAYLDRYAEPDKNMTDRDESWWPAPYWDIDTGMAGMLLLLGATDAGLATCYFGVPVEAHAAVKQAFGIDERLHLVAAISLGYGLPDRKSPSLKRGRRGLDQVVSYNRMG
jgi:nitroreductase